MPQRGLGPQVPCRVGQRCRRLERDCTRPEPVCKNCGRALGVEFEADYHQSRRYGHFSRLAEAIQNDGTTNNLQQLRRSGVRLQISHRHVHPGRQHYGRVVLGRLIQARARVIAFCCTTRVWPGACGRELAPAAAATSHSPTPLRGTPPCWTSVLQLGALDGNALTLREFSLLLLILDCP